MNITLDAAKGVAWNKCQQMLKRSQWFLERGTLGRQTDPQWQPPKGIELIIGSEPSHIIGRAVFGFFADEVSFKKGQDIEKQKRKAAEIRYNTLKNETIDTFKQNMVSKTGVLQNTFSAQRHLHRCLHRRLPAEKKTHPCRKSHT